MKFFLLLVSTLLLCACSEFTYKHAIVYERPGNQTYIFISDFRIDGTGFNPVFDQSVKDFLRHSLMKQGFWIVDKVNDEEHKPEIILKPSLLVAKPDILSEQILASYTFEIETFKTKMTSNGSSEVLTSSQTWLFKQPYNVADARLMNLFDKVAIDLKLALKAGPVQKIDLSKSTKFSSLN